MRLATSAASRGRCVWHTSAHCTISRLHTKPSSPQAMVSHSCDFPCSSDVGFGLFVCAHRCEVHFAASTVLHHTRLLVVAQTDRHQFRQRRIWLQTDLQKRSHACAHSHHSAPQLHTQSVALHAPHHHCRARTCGKARHSHRSRFGRFPLRLSSLLVCQFNILLLARASGQASEGLLERSVHLAPVL
jgi:hypothetical protein